MPIKNLTCKELPIMLNKEFDRDNRDNMSHITLNQYCAIMSLLLILQLKCQFLFVFLGKFNWHKFCINNGSWFNKNR